MLNPSLDRFNQDRKKGKNSTFERNLNGVLAPSLTSLRVKPAIPCVLLSILRTGENRRWIDDQVKVGEEIIESR